MALQIEQQTRDIGVVRTTLGPERTRVVVRPGDAFRFVDDAGQPLVRAPRLRVRRIDNNLILDGLPDGRELELNNFFGACRPGAECTVSLTGIGLPGALPITEETPPTAALADGSFLLYSDNADAAALAALPAAQVADSGGPSWLAIGGAAVGLGIAAGAAGGGGGSGGPVEDTTPPGAPVVTSGAVLKRSAPIVTGEAEAGARVTVRVDVNGNGFDASDLTFVTNADAQGRWTIDLSSTPQSGSLPVGGLVAGLPYAIEVRATDGALNVSPLSRSTVTLAAPDAPVINAVAGDDFVNAAERTGGVLLSGTAQPGTTVSVRIGSVVVAGAVDTAGEWRVAFEASQLPQSGVATVQATAADAIGPGATATRTVTFDSVAPIAPVIGVVANDDIVNAAELALGIVVSGTTEARSTVELRIGTTVATAIADTSGSWSVPLQASQLPSTGFATLTAIAIDPAGNASPSSTRQVLFETNVPGAPVITDNVSGVAGGPTTPTVTFTITFDKPITGFTGADISVQGGTLGAFTAVGGTNGTVYTQVVTPTAGVQGGQIVLNVPTGAGSDLAGNPSTAGVSIQAYDTAAPTVAITNDAVGTVASNVRFTFTFSETVTGFDVSDVAVVNGTVVGGSFAGNGTTYTVDVAPTAGFAGSTSVSTSAGAAVDAVGLASAAGAPSSASVDRQGPTLTVTDSVAAAVTAGPVVFTFTASEAVTGFVGSDVTVTGGSITTAFAQVGTSNAYTIGVTPSAGIAAGTVGVAVAAGAIADLFGNASTAAASGSQAIDTLGPTFNSVTDSAPGTASGPVTFTFTFSEPVAGFAQGDIVVSAGAAVSGFAGSGSQYTAVVTPPPGTGTFTVDVPAGSYTDGAGNAGAAAPQASQAYAPLDTTPPTVVITDDQAGTLTNASPTAVFTFTWSEPVTGFTYPSPTDITVSGAAGGTLTFIADSATVYRLQFTAAAGTAGTLGLTVPAGVAIDGAANGNSGPVSTTQAYDRAPPTVTVADNVVAAQTNAPVTFTFTTSEAVTGFDGTDLTVSGGSVSTPFAQVGTSNTYTITVTPTANVASGTISVSVGANAFADPVGNLNATGATGTQGYDTQAPTQTATGVVVETPGNTPVTDGGSTGDATPLLRITLSSVLGVGESLTVTRTGPGGTVTVPQTAVGGPAYEYQEASTLASGSYTYSASIADALGNSRTLDINGASAGTDYTIVVL